MPLADRVVVSRRFQRSVRIDTDLDHPLALDGFVCPESSAVVLQSMARHLAESGHGAFTWTGPYGSGKSSLVVALSALIGPDEDRRQEAASAVGWKAAADIWEAMPPKQDGWRVLPIVGRRDLPERLVEEAVYANRLGRGLRSGWSEKQALDALQRIAMRHPDSTGGLIVFIDEMGKLLEGAARDASDVYFFQQLAEVASRSGGRLVVVGILHQAFEEYSYRLSREMRDEWAKIQGRFIDLPVNVGADEQIALLGRAIESDHRPLKPGHLSNAVASLAKRAVSEDLADLLEACWPLHPVVACLLGPISRRRFGQNQRSIFGFLNSSEPSGFQDFLRNTQESDLYIPELLWEYLRLNLEPSIMASPDGHRWALAVDALERCQALGGGEVHLRLLETIALVDLFKERSGLSPSLDLLSCVYPEIGSQHITNALTQLQRWSLVVYRKFSDSYSIFEGSDFDVDEAVRRALEAAGEEDFPLLDGITDLQPIVAKRHYHETGAMRWYDVAIAPLENVQSNPEGYQPRPGGAGTFVLAVPTHNEPVETARLSASQAVCGVDSWDLVIGLSPESWSFSSLARELVATERVRDESPELQGDRVARREVEARLASLRGYVEGELSRAFDHADWYTRDRQGQRFTQAGLNGLASELADRRFSATPRLHNELLNRVKPSSNAIAAQNYLLRRMALHEGEERLGIKGFPAEGGLFTSLLESSRLYLHTPQGWVFIVPSSEGDDPCNLAPAWRVAKDVLESNKHRAVSLAEIYDIWREQPFGIKDGLLPVLASAFILSMRRDVAFYRQSVFQARVTDLDMDYLARDPRDVQLRWMDLSEASRNLLSEMAATVRDLDDDNSLLDLEPIDVAKGLVSIYDQLPPWVGRTQHLTSNAKRVRQLFKQASDPNRLIFDDIPRLLSDGLDVDQRGSMLTVSNNVHEGLSELKLTYPAMLHRLRETLLAELQVPNASAPMLAELRARAENVRELSGDHRMEAFVIRLAQFSGSEADMESLASMVANKPSQIWVDADIDRATVELADMAQRFLRVESFAHVKGRANKRHAMAVTVGMSGRPATVQDEFAVSSLEGPDVQSLVSKMLDLLQDLGEERRNVVLAALAELSAHYLDSVEANVSQHQPAVRRKVNTNGL